MKDPQDRALVTVYRHRRKGTYFVQPKGYEEQTGFLREMDEPIVVSSADDAERIASAIEAGLRLFNAASLRSMPLSDEEDAKFRRSHDAVAIRRYPDGTTDVEPREHVRGGYKGMPEEKIVLRSGASPADLVAAVAEAFRRAG